MATKQAVELGMRLRGARRAMEREIGLVLWGGSEEGQAAAIKALERAAIAVGEERERGRQAKRKGPRR
jgi:hypothetical protein